MLAIRCSSKALPCTSISSVTCPGTCSTSSHPADQSPDLRVFSFAWCFSLRHRIEDFFYSLFGPPAVRVSHVAASSSPLTDVWPVRALIEKCIFSLLSSRSRLLLPPSHSRRGSRHDPSVHTCNLPSQRWSVACIFHSASQLLSSRNCRYLIGSVGSFQIQELGVLLSPKSYLCVPGAWFPRSWADVLFCFAIPPEVGQVFVLVATGWTQPRDNCSSRPQRGTSVTSPARIALGCPFWMPVGVFSPQRSSRHLDVKFLQIFLLLFLFAACRSLHSRAAWRILCFQSPSGHWVTCNLSQFSPRARSPMTTQYS